MLTKKKEDITTKTQNKINNATFSSSSRKNIASKKWNQIESGYEFDIILVVIFFIMTTNTCNYAAVNDAHSNRKKVLFNKMPLFSLLLFAFILQRTECEMSFIKMNAYVYFSLVKCKSARQCVHDAHDLFINSLLPALSMTSSVAQHKNNKKKRI